MAPLLILALAPMTGGAQDWWPDRSLAERPAELLEIPSLADPSFAAQIREAQAAIRRGQLTDRTNFEERANLARRYYNALQADGLLIPRIALLAANLAQSRSPDPEEMFRLYSGAVDGILLGGAVLEQNRGRLGRLEMVSPRTGEPLEARRYTTLKFVYRVGRLALEPGAKIRFSGHWYNDMSPPQFDRPHMPGFTTVRASRAGVRLLTGMEYWNAVGKLVSAGTGAAGGDSDRGNAGGGRHHHVHAR
ncbi:MAG: hypothetical protein GY953_23500 [bacterium]|nr:hypothetical protein [bacterium]